jgi:hypothetical protein
MGSALKPDSLILCIGANAIFGHTKVSELACGKSKIKDFYRTLTITLVLRKAEVLVAVTSRMIEGIRNRP